MTPASAGSIDFIEPVTGPVAALLLSPKPENRTLPSERFIALAISCVSSVPAEPTTMPAMIIAAFCSTKPSNATARPVRALYSEITTGMSAPPIGSVIVTPSTSASTKNAVTTAGLVFMPVAISAPSTTATARISILKNCWPPKRKDFLMSPCSLPNAMPEPENDTAPIRPPSTANAPNTGLSVGPRYSSTAAIAAAAPPPMPL